MPAIHPKAGRVARPLRLSHGRRAHSAALSTEGAAEADNYAVEDALMHDTTALAFEIVANDRDGMRVELQTIGQAARFLRDEFIGERAADVDWRLAAASLEAASRNLTLVKHATEAVHNLLETEGILATRKARAIGRGDHARIAISGELPSAKPRRSCRATVT